MVQQSFTDLCMACERDQHKGVTISKPIHSFRSLYPSVMNEAEAL